MSRNFTDASFKKRLSKLGSFGANGLIYSSSAIVRYIKGSSYTQKQQCEAICEWFLEDECKHLEQAIAKAVAYKGENLYRAYPTKKGDYRTIDLHRKNSYTQTMEYEKNIAKALFRIYENHQEVKLYGLMMPRVLRTIGVVRDFEIPLHSPGKRNIDLISSIGKSQLVILELKKNHADETLLRCILEAYTYSLICDRDILRRSFDMDKDAKLVICPLIFRDSTAFDDLQDMCNRPKLRRLISEIETHDRAVAIRFAVLSNELITSIPDFGCKFDRSWID